MVDKNFKMMYYLENLIVGGLAHAG